MNKHDSERIAGLLEINGYKKATNGEQYIDLVIFNTCCVREKAANKLYGNAIRYANKKKDGRDFLIAIGGCLAQKEAKKISRKIPEVDIIFGTSKIGILPEIIEKTKFKSSPVIETEMDGDIFSSSLPSKRENEISAWVQISTGCNNYCTYCIVPYVRGAERSRPFDEIIAEVDELAKDGVKEITLLGQNVNSYGNDLGINSYFSKLLLRLDEIEGINRIRFTTSHPKDLSLEIVEIVKNSKNICEHFHLPVQSGSSRILAKMNRSYNQSYFLDLISNIRDLIPGVAVTTDIIVGFPGEDEQDFIETLKILDIARFDNAFTFIYSPRSKTRAALLKETIDDQEKTDRFKRLLERQNQISLEINKELIGQSFEVLVEGRSKKNKDLLTGRTRKNKIVHFPGSDNLIHQLVRVTIKEAFTWYLGGEIDGGYK